MLDFAICAVANLLRIYVIERFVGVFLGKPQADRRKVFGVCACFYIANILLYWTFHTVWINIACSLIGIGAVVRLHTKSFRTNLFVTCSTYIINMGCDTLATLPFVQFRNAFSDRIPCPCSGSSISPSNTDRSPLAMRR